MAIHVLFHQCLTNPHTPPSISEREISVRPACLCALVGFFCFVMLVPGLLVAQTEFQGDVSGVWDPGGNPYIQVGEANVPAEQALTILPGVEVVLLPENWFRINGQLTAIGNAIDTIRFHRRKVSLAAAFGSSQLKMNCCLLSVGSIRWRKPSMAKEKPPFKFKTVISLIAALPHAPDPV